MAVECRLGNGESNYCGYLCLKRCSNDPTKKLPVYLFKKRQNLVVESLYQEFPELRPNNDSENEVKGS